MVVLVLVVVLVEMNVLLITLEMVLVEVIRLVAMVGIVEREVAKVPLVLQVQMGLPELTEL